MVILKLCTACTQKKERGRKGIHTKKERKGRESTILG